MNKYLEKIAGSKLDALIRIGDDLVGHSHRALAHEAEILSKAEALGRTAKQAFGEARDAGKRSLKTRIVTNLSIGGLGTAGFLGIHKYHQHKDRAILKKIDEMYAKPDNS